MGSIARFHPKKVRFALLVTYPSPERPTDAGPSTAKAYPENDEYPVHDRLAELDDVATEIAFVIQWVGVIQTKLQIGRAHV